jgi:hypothetical protein
MFSFSFVCTTVARLTLSKLQISNLTMPLLIFNDLAGASPTSDVLGPPVVAAPQQQDAFVPPCFTFGSGSPPNTKAKQQATDCYKPSQHDYMTT